MATSTNEVGWSSFYLPHAANARYPLYSWVGWSKLLAQGNTITKSYLTLLTRNEAYKEF